MTVVLERHRGVGSESSSIDSLCVQIATAPSRVPLNRIERRYRRGPARGLDELDEHPGLGRDEEGADRARYGSARARPTLEACSLCGPRDKDGCLARGQMHDTAGCAFGLGTVARGEDGAGV